MTQRATPVTCPNCGTPFAANLQQLFDVGMDPTAKQRFLQGDFNVLQCPTCSLQFQVATPLIYHDPGKELFITYVPMELNLPPTEKERLLGQMTQALMSALPPEARKGYLLQPRDSLTLQGMLEQVLAADGITREMLDAQQRKVELISQLVMTDESALLAEIRAHDADIDLAFLELVGAMAQSAVQNGDDAMAARLMKVRELAVQESTVGQDTQAQSALLEATARELSELGEQLTPDKLLALVLSAEDDDRVAILTTLARPLMDYDFLVALSNRVEAASEAERPALEARRQVVLETLNDIDAIARERGNQVTGTLQRLLQAPDLEAAVKAAMPEIDDTFMGILAQNYDAAMKAGRQDVADRLQAIGDMVMRVLSESAPPEVRFVNQLLSQPDEDSALLFIKQQAATLPPTTVEAMAAIGDQLRGAGRNDMADRLDGYREAVKREVSLARWT